MLKVKYSPQNEISLDGTLADWQDFRDRILAPNWQQVEVMTATGIDPAPYDRLLSSISFTKTDELLDIGVDRDILQISGRSDLLELLADNCPYDVIEHGWPIPYHVHFDRLGREEYLSEEAIGLILCLDEDDGN